MISPGYVKKNFSASALSYDAAAVFQRRAAALLAKFIKKNSYNEKNSLKILEIGCGTGFLTERLLKLFPDSEFLISDISEEMLEVCRNKIKGANRNVSFETIDASENLPGKDYDLIVSAMTFQWFPDLKHTAGILAKKLGPAGRLFFSTLEESTFSRLRGVFDELGARYPGPRFLSMDELKNSLAPFESIALEKHCYSVKYPSLIDFFNALSMTGAVNATGEGMKVPSVRKIIKAYSALYENVVEDYHLVLAACENK